MAEMNKNAEQELEQVKNAETIPEIIEFILHAEWAESVRESMAKGIEISDGVSTEAKSMMEATKKDWDKKSNDGSFVPSHEWSGTKLRFKNPNGTNGAYQDLQGPAGSIENATAKDIAMENGSNVEVELSSSFSLGSYKGIRNKQSKNGLIVLDSISVLSVKSTGAYYCSKPTDSPTGENGYLFVFALSDDLVLIEFENGGNSTARYRRKLINGVWNDWQLIGGEAILTSTTMSVGGAGVTIPLMKAYSKLRVFVNGIGYVDLTPTGMDANGNYNRFAGAGRPLASDGTTVYTEVVVSVDYTGTSGLVKLLKAKSSSYAAIANIESSANKQITSIRGIV